MFDTITLTNRRRMREREEYTSNQAWYASRYSHRCDNCTKQTRLYSLSVYWFDIGAGEGYDSMDYTECWWCSLKGTIRGIRYRCKRNIQVVKSAVELWSMMKSPWYSAQRISKAIDFARRINK